MLEINASRENSIDTIRDKITGFVQTMPFGDFKVVLLDEADYISPNGQAALRGVMETYHASARFILTCNYPNRVIPALHSVDVKDSILKKWTRQSLLQELPQCWLQRMSNLILKHWTHMYVVPIQIYVSV